LVVKPEEPSRAPETWTIILGLLELDSESIYYIGTSGSLVLLWLSFAAGFLLSGESRKENIRKDAGRDWSLDEQFAGW